MAVMKSVRETRRVSRCAPKSSNQRRSPKLPRFGTGFIAVGEVLRDGLV